MSWWLVSRMRRINYPEIDMVGGWGCFIRHVLAPAVSSRRQEAAALAPCDWGSRRHRPRCDKRLSTMSTSALPDPTASSVAAVKRGDQLSMMIDKIPTLAWSCRPDGTTEFLNQRWLDYTGLSLEASLGWGWKVAIHPDDLEKLMNTWLRVLASGEPGDEEARLRRFDGEYRWFLFRAVPVRDEQGKLVRWYGTNTDVEDLKRAELQVRRDALELGRIVDAIPQAIVVLAPDGRVLYANEAVLQYTG